MGNKQIKKPVILSIAVITILFALCIGETAGSTGEGSISSEDLTQISVSSENTTKLYGINFGPYVDGQNPNYGSQVDREQVKERLTIIAPYTIWIRTYGTENGLENIGPVAHEMGLKTAIGAWLGSDTDANDKQINELIDEAKNGYVDLAIVGSETLLRNDLSEDELIEYIRRVKQEIPGINVTTADTYGELLSHPKVMAECDVIMYNSYPYWEGISIDSAIEMQNKVYKSLVDQAKNKPVIVSETGWPSAGNTIRSAVPSSENSARYFNDFVSWANKNNVQYFYFEAFDEAWKANYEDTQGAHWGVWDKDGNMKPGMEITLSGESETKETNETDSGLEELESEPGIVPQESVSASGFAAIYGLAGLLAVFLYRRK